MLVNLDTLPGRVVGDELDLRIGEPLRVQVREHLDDLVLEISALLDDLRPAPARTPWDRPLSVYHDSNVPSTLTSLEWMH